MTTHQAYPMPGWPSVEDSGPIYLLCGVSSEVAPYESVTDFR